MAHVHSVSQIAGPHLIIEELRDELVIFDRTTNRAHMLDSRAASIWRASAGGVKVDCLHALVDAATDEERRSLVFLAIADLERAGLMVTDRVSRNAVSRRGLLKNFGAAAAMPLVISILAPTTAAAQTQCNTSAAAGSFPNTLMIGSCNACATDVTGMAMGNCVLNTGGFRADGCTCTTPSQCCSNNCSGAGRCV